MLWPTQIFKFEPQFVHQEIFNDCRTVLAMAYGRIAAVTGANKGIGLAIGDDTRLRVPAQDHCSTQLTLLVAI
jgi:hypothetical protein